jgi:hypothetical protein
MIDLLLSIRIRLGDRRLQAIGDGRSRMLIKGNVAGAVGHDEQARAAGQARHPGEVRRDRATARRDLGYCSSRTSARETIHDSLLISMIGWLVSIRIRPEDRHLREIENGRPRMLIKRNVAGNRRASPVVSAGHWGHELRSGTLGRRRPDGARGSRPEILDFSPDTGPHCKVVPCPRPASPDGAGPTAEPGWGSATSAPQAMRAPRSCLAPEGELSPDPGRGAGPGAGHRVLPRARRSPTVSSAREPFFLVAKSVSSASPPKTDSRLVIIKLH